MKKSIKGLGLASLALLILSACSAPGSTSREEHQVLAEFHQDLHDRLPEDIRGLEPSPWPTR